MKKAGLLMALTLLLAVLLGAGKAQAQTLPQDGYQDFCGMASLDFEPLDAQALMEEMIGYDGYEKAKDYQGQVPPQSLNLIEGYAEYERYLDWLAQKGYKMRYGLPGIYEYGQWHGQLMEKEGRRLFVRVSISGRYTLQVYDLSALPEAYSMLAAPPIYEKPENKEDYQAFRDYHEHLASPWGYQAQMGRHAVRSQNNSGELIELFGMDNVFETLWEEGKLEEAAIALPETYGWLEFTETAYISGTGVLYEYLGKLAAQGFEETLQRVSWDEDIKATLLAYDQGPGGGRLFVICVPRPDTDVYELTIMDMSDYSHELMSYLYDLYGHENRLYDFGIIGNWANIFRYKGGAEKPGELALPAMLGGLPVRGLGAAALEGAKGIGIISLPPEMTYIHPDAFLGLEDSVIRVELGSMSHQSLLMTGHIRVDDYLPAEQEAEPPKTFSSYPYSYEILNDGSLRITEYYGNADEDVVVPAEINGRPIKVIGSGAFTNLNSGYEVEDGWHEDFVNLSLSEGIQSIEEGGIVYTVNNAGAPTLNLPASIEHIAVNGIQAGMAGLDVNIHPDNNNYRFAAEYGDYCLVDLRTGWMLGYLGDVTFSTLNVPAGVRHIPAKAVSGWSTLDNVTLPEGLESIGDEAFADTQLYSLHLPDSLISLGCGVFAGTYISELELPPSLRVIQGHPCAAMDGAPFREPPAKLSLARGSKWLYLRDNAIYSRSGPALLLHLTPENLQEFALPGDIRAIAPLALQKATGLDKLNLPEGLETIGDLALAWSPSDYGLPKSLRFLGRPAAYARRTQLLDFREGAPYLVSAYAGYGNALASYIQVRPGSETEARLLALDFSNLLSHDGQLYFPKGLVYALNDRGEAILFRYKLPPGKSLVFPAEVEGHPLAEIAPNAGIELRGVRQLRFQNPLRVIGSKAFGTLGDLLLVLPESLTGLGSEAFDLYGESTVVLPPSLENAGNLPFGELGYYLAKYYYPQGSASLEQVPLFYKENASPLPGPVQASGDWLYCPREGGGLKLHSYWGGPSDELALPHDALGQPVLEVADNARISLEAVKRLVIAAPLIRIGNNAFIDMGSVAEIILPESLESIGNRGFEGLNLKSIKLPASLKSLEAEAFGWEFALSKVMFEVAGGSPAEAWVEEHGLQRYVDMGKPVESLFTWRLRDDGLAEITGYTGPERNQLVIPGSIGGQSISAIAADAAINIQQVNSLVIEAPIAEIGTKAFGYAEYLGELSLPDTLIRVGSKAMAIQNGAMTLRLPDNLSDIPLDAFGFEEYMRGWTYAASPGSPAEAWVKAHGFYLSEGQDERFDWLNSP